MRVISFKVDDDVYATLRKKKVSFRQLFEPYAYELIKNPHKEMRIPSGIPTNSSRLYIDLKALLQKYENEAKK